MNRFAAVLQIDHLHSHRRHHLGGGHLGRWLGRWLRQWCNSGRRCWRLAKEWDGGYGKRPIQVDNTLTLQHMKWYCEDLLELQYYYIYIIQSNSVFPMRSANKPCRSMWYLIFIITVTVVSVSRIPLDPSPNNGTPVLETTSVVWSKTS